MIRILFFLVPVFLIGLGFAWLAERPGDVVLTFGGYRYETSLLVVAVAVVLLVAAVMLLWGLIKGLWNSPHLIARHFRHRRRDRGYDALSAGLIAAGAGDVGLARRKKKEALKLLGTERTPLIHLLDAQSSLLEGDHAAARAKFEAMRDDPEMKLLGLRGLYLEAERLGDHRAARHYADTAVEAAPQLGWASVAALEERSEAGDWDGALKLVETQRSTRQIDRETADRRKAVLLTARAMELLDADPGSARNAALEANRLAPDLVPAAVTAARALFRLDDLRKGARLLEAAFKRNAHPEIAEAYVHARLGDSTHDRLARARKLQALKQNNPESALAVARAALAAGEYRLARENAEAAIRQEPREGAYLLLADIEEAETGDQGRVRQWMGKAVRAPSDPAWVADGYVAENWAPVSPVTGRLDAFEWRAPVERLGQVIEAGDEALALAPLPAPERPATVPATPPDAEAATARDDSAAEPSPMPAAAAADEAETPTQAEPTKAPAADNDAAPEPPKDFETASGEGDTGEDENGRTGRAPRALVPDDPGIEDGRPRKSASAGRFF